jgi:prepilin-type N-terminal cleavage/methylation domain-containing protein
MNFKSNKGVTLVELVVIMAIIGILAVAIIPQFQGALNSVRLRTAKEKLIDDLYFAHNYAITEHRLVWFGINQGDNSYSYGVYNVSGGDSLLTDISTRQPSTVDLDDQYANVLITSETFSGRFEYNWWGTPSTGGSITLNGTDVITIYPETGFIYAP